MRFACNAVVTKVVDHIEGQMNQVNINHLKFQSGSAIPVIAPGNAMQTKGLDEGQWSMLEPYQRQIAFTGERISNDRPDGI